MGYTILFVLITNTNDVILSLKGFLLNNRVPMTPHTDKSNDENIPIGGCVQIITLFFQVAGLLQVKFQGGQQSKDSSSLEGVREHISMIWDG